MFLNLYNINDFLNKKMNDFIKWQNENLRNVANVPNAPFAISSGEISGVASNFKFGRVVSTRTTEEVIWDGGGTYEFLTAGETMTVVSDDVNDTMIGSVELTANPTAGEVIVFSESGVERTIEFVVGTPGTDQVEIGVDADATAASLATEISGTATLAVVEMPYGTKFVSSTATVTATRATGAFSVVVYGLDDNYEEIIETVELNGTTPVTTTGVFLRVFRALVLEAGTNSTVSDSNIGNITIAPSVSTTKTQAKILEHVGQTLMCVYTVPAGKTMYVTGLGYSIGKAKEVLLVAKTRLCGTNCAFQTKYTTELYESNNTAPLAVPFKVPEKSDIVLNSVAGATGSRISASFGFVLVDND